MQNIITKKSRINKKGVFANKDFEIGEIVMKWDTSNTLSKEDAEMIPESQKIYLSNYEHGKFLLQQPPARYVNHSCDPNTEVQNYCDVAIKRIKKGEELTSDYTKYSIGLHFKCNCGSKNCKGSL